MKDAPARLWENIDSLSTLQVLNYLVPLITVPYLVRVLGATHFGLLSFSQAVIVYFDLLTDYGFNFSATRALASHRNEPGEVARIFWRTTFTKTALMLASGVALVILVAAIPRLRETPWLYAAWFLTVIGTVTCPVWFFQGLEQMKILTITLSSARILTVPALMFLVRQPDHYLRAAFIQGAVPIVASLLLLPALRKNLPRAPCLPRLDEIPAVLKEGWHVFLANTSLVVNASTSTVVLGLIAGTKEVGYYSAADKIVRAVSSLLGPTAQALYPHLNSLMVRSAHTAFRLMRKSYGYILLLAGAASLATFLLSAPMGRLLWGDAFFPSIGILRCLSPLPFLLALGNVIGAQTMLVLELDAQVSRILLLGPVINIPLVAGLSEVTGALGAAMATVTTALIMALLLARGLQRQIAVGWRVERTCAP